MTHLNLTGCKKRKRGERVFGFRSFCERGNPVDFNGSFRDNMKKLLEFARLESKLCGGMKSWSFQLELHRHPSVHISLFVIEEPINNSLTRHCHHCHIVGWGNHMICNERFHFVLPSKETSLVMTVCSSCEGDGTMKGKPNIVELQGHLLHGVLHSNGFGHLICINGIEKGSELAGSELMDFWDRICTGLHARKVSVNDVAKKRNMDLRLIHGVAFGDHWFGRWGYRFGQGNFSVTHPMYQKAIEGIQSIPLCLIIQHSSISDQEIVVIFNRYQTISGHSLSTLGHLFCFLHELKSRLPLETAIISNYTETVAETCRWSPKRIEMATRVIVEALKKAKFRWVSRQEVRDAARVYIGDTGLLDFVLKSLGNHIVGSHVVRRTLNPVTKVLEYCLQDISNMYSSQEGFFLCDPTMKYRYQMTRVQLTNDIYYLYNYIFKETMSTGIFSTIQIASRIILDTKHLVKDYGGELSPQIESVGVKNLKLLCTISLKRNENENDPGIKKALPPHNLIILPPHATFRELKREVEKSFRETYWGLSSFVADSVINVNAKESDLVLGLVEAGSSLVVGGTIIDKEIDIEEIYESSKENCGFVDCPCGVKEDDGERMIACDICELSQHTRCVQMSTTEDVPHIFICSRCEKDMFIFPSVP